MKTIRPREEAMQDLAKTGAKAVIECPYCIGRVRGDVPDIGGYSLCCKYQRSVNGDGKLDYFGDLKVMSPFELGYYVFGIYRCRSTGELIPRYNHDASRRFLKVATIFNTDELEELGERLKLEEGAKRNLSRERRGFAVALILPPDVQIGSIREDFRALTYELISEDRLLLKRAQREILRKNMGL